MLLSENEELYSAIVDGFHDSVLVIDEQFRIIYVNERLCRASGYSREQFIARSFIDFLPEDSQSLIIERYRQRQQGQSPPSKYEFSFVHKNGQRGYAELKSFVFHTQTGKTWTICHLSDITKRLTMGKALRKSEEQLRQITDNMEDLVARIDMKGQIEYVSPSVKKALDYDADQMLGRTVFSLIHEDDLLLARRILKQSEKGVNNKTELRIRHQDGRFLWFEAVGSTICDEQKQVVGAVLTVRDISVRKEVENHLRQSEATFRALTESSVVAIFVIQGDKFKYVNPAFTNVSGYSLEDLQNLSFWEIVDPEMRGFVRERGMARQAKEAIMPRYELKFINKSGEIRIGDFGATYLTYEGRPALIASILDITDRKRNEEQLRSSEERYRTIIQNIEDGYFEVDLTGNLTHISDPCLKITGAPNREAVIGTNFREFCTQENWPKIYQSFSKVFETGESLKELELETIRLDKARQHIEISVSLMRDETENPVGFRGIVRDVTQRKQNEHKIQWMAYHDNLTGLPNRTLFYDRAGMIMAQAKRKQYRFGLMMLDLDRFKEVNDQYGHNVGDQVLIVVADRLKKSLREEDTAARLGGDEFVVILPEVTSIEDVHLVGKRIVDSLQEPFLIDQLKLTAAWSIGLAFYPDDGDNLDALIRHADESMYKIKFKGGGLNLR